MAHDHHHDSETYYLDQLCLVGISGAFSLICITMYFWQRAMLVNLLAPQFHDMILITGVVLGILVLVRSVVLWRSVGRNAAPAHEHPHEQTREHSHHHGHGHDHAHAHDHGHTHEHAHSHAHDHQHHDHDHADDHEHNWAPWRYVVLLIPVALYLLGQPDKGPGGQDNSQVTDTVEVGARVALVSAGPLPFHQSVLAAGMLVDPYAQDIRITIAGKPASLKDLKPDMAVTLKLFDDRKIVLDTVQEVHAEPLSPIEGRKLRLGKIKAVNIEEKLLTVIVDDEGSKVEREFDLALGPPFGMDFKTLESLAYVPQIRNDYNGKTVQVVGQYAPRFDNDRVFTLVRHRIQCCRADAIQLDVPIISREPLKGLQPDQWVKVTGRVEFLADPRQPNRLRTVLRVSRKVYVVPTSPDPEIYVR